MKDIANIVYEFSNREQLLNKKAIEKIINILIYKLDIKEMIKIIHFYGSESDYKSSRVTYGYYSQPEKEISINTGIIRAFEKEKNTLGTVKMKLNKKSKKHTL